MMILSELTKVTTDQMRSILNKHDDINVFTVRVGTERISMLISHVQTVFKITAMTPVPLGPSHMLGLVNLRGQITPAISMHLKLGQPMPDHTEDLLAIGTEINGQSFALVVDEVGDVLRISSSTRIHLPTSLIPHANGREIPHLAHTAYYQMDDGLLAVLDVESLLNAHHATQAQANHAHAAHNTHHAQAA